MTDPRADIPDTILDAPDGSRWLARSAQLIVGAGRNEAPRITLDAEIMPVINVVDGVAQTLPLSIREGRSYDLSDVPPELALALATWMADQAGPNGQALLDRKYPQPPAAVIESETNQAPEQTP